VQPPTDYARADLRRQPGTASAPHPTPPRDALPLPPWLSNAARPGVIPPRPRTPGVPATGALAVRPALLSKSCHTSNPHSFDPGLPSLPFTHAAPWSPATADTHHPPAATFTGLQTTHRRAQRVNARCFHTATLTTCAPQGTEARSTVHSARAKE
jgi:hypothetical protein